MDPSWPPQLQLANMNCRNTRCHSTRCRRYIVDAAKCNNTRCNIATCSALTPQPVVPHTCNLHMCGAKTTPQHNFTEHHSTSDVIAIMRVHTISPTSSYEQHATANNDTALLDMRDWNRECFLRNIPIAQHRSYTMRLHMDVRTTFTSDINYAEPI